MPPSPQQMYEAPACVQNAMMNKDKKPFTYTPGGIDLSQIKSERMARRLARNAQAEGVGGNARSGPTVSSPHSPNGNFNSMAASSLGMPFQVLPPTANSPTSPSLAAGKSLNCTPQPPPAAPAPPPPPPSSYNTQPTHNQGSIVAGTAANTNRALPAQRFEPPPIGFRPQIKIPSNPIAGLRKITPPVEKNSFWKDEYVKDRSKSPMIEQQDRYAETNTSDNSNNTVDGENEAIIKELLLLKSTKNITTKEKLILIKLRLIQCY